MLLVVHSGRAGTFPRKELMGEAGEPALRNQTNEFIRHYKAF